MHDPMIQIYGCRWFSLWHVDPERGPGGDDSCGWFKRSHHGDKSVLERIVKRFEEDWDRTWTYDPKEDGGGEDEQSRGKTTYPCGFFNPNGMPRLSVVGVTLNLFFLAAGEHFESDGRSNWNKARRFMQRNLFDIMFFAENTTDSLHDSMTLKFGNDTRREDRLRTMACIIYGWILRREQRWWQHPRWHMHHWKLQVHAIQQFKRWAFSRCCKCGGRFRFGESPVTSNWNSKGPRWFRGQTDIYHDDCGGHRVVDNQCGKAV